MSLLKQKPFSEEDRVRGANTEITEVLKKFKCALDVKQSIMIIAVKDEVVKPKKES